MVPTFTCERMNFSFRYQLHHRIHFDKQKVFCLLTFNQLRKILRWVGIDSGKCRAFEVGVFIIELRSSKALSLAYWIIESFPISLFKRHLIISWVFHRIIFFILIHHVNYLQICFKVLFSEIDIHFKCACLYRCLFNFLIKSRIQSLIRKELIDGAPSRTLLRFFWQRRFSLDRWKKIDWMRFD